MATRTRQEEEEDIKHNEPSLLFSLEKAGCVNIGLHVAPELSSVISAVGDLLSRKKRMKLDDEE
jgi:hypothetical protein